MDEVKLPFPFPAPFPFPVPLIGGTGKTGKPGVPEIPETGQNGKNGKVCECSDRIEALGTSLAKVSPCALNGVAGFSGYSRQSAETLDPGELLEALERNTAIMMKIASLVDACIRRLSPEARADAFQEAREGTP